MVCGDAISAPIRTIVGKTLEINNYPLTVVGVADPTFHGTTVVYDVEVYISVMMAPQLGFNFGSQQTTPSGILADRRAAVLYPHGYLRPGTTLASAAAQADALWAMLSRDRPLTGCRAAAEGRAVLANTERRADDAVADADRAERDGSAGPDDRLRQHRGARAGAWRVATRRNRPAAGARRDADADRPSADRRKPRPRRARRVLGVAARASRRSRSLSATPNRSPRPSVSSSMSASTVSSSVLPCWSPAGARWFSDSSRRFRASRVDLVSVINEDASPRGATRSRLRASLVVAQVAVSLLLLVGAGLATRSVEAARRAHPGFDASHLTAITLDLKQNAYDEPRGRVFYRHLLDAARADAGIESATLAAYMPMGFLDTPRGASRSRAMNRVEAKICRSCRTPSVPTTSALFGSP